MFRYLAIAYLVTFLLIVPIMIHQVTDPNWVAFDAGFNRLLKQHFSWREPQDNFWILVGLILTTHIMATIGLLWFRRWAKWLFAGTTVVLILASPFAGGPVTYFDSVSMVIQSLVGSLAGAILLLSFARGFGNDWFGPSPRLKVVD
jgi:hypothetical protein